jgi:hypothetical protein
MLVVAVVVLALSAVMLLVLLVETVGQEQQTVLQAHLSLIQAAAAVVHSVVRLAQVEQTQATALPMTRKRLRLHPLIVVVAAAVVVLRLLVETVGLEVQVK